MYVAVEFICVFVCVYVFKYLLAYFSVDLEKSVNTITLMES